MSGTEYRLQHALLSLIGQKRYEAITIKDICDLANVGRSTFYAHYRGKDDLKRSGLENLRPLLGNRQGRFGFSLAMFEHARQHMDIYRALAGGRGGTVALAHIRQLLSDVVRDELEPSQDAVAREAAVQFVVGAYMALLSWWLDNGAKFPPQRLDAIFRQLAAEGVPSAKA